MPSITQLMSRNPVSVEPDDSLLVVKEIFDQVKFHHILVVENNVLLGVISDRDLFKALSPNLGTAAETTKDLATLKKRVHQVMHRKPVTLPVTAEVMDAVRVFNQDNVSCIPVVDQQQRPLGIVSWRDIMRALGKKEAK
ncbi:CBS domain-containing protein [Alkalimonas collagenimarina]|uniref:CBS domain-containing protein n=1 Tax=Alkalimonas collagenimarina TaxID=400390 RepID=A0ABT9GV13_9GAMM|nr:CBS domain-containing protein [Alkalimonas collagenimarina]MDP4534866.1 CBS domain-containing protein [Alkalimonas collagenimarina]